MTNHILAAQKIIARQLDRAAERADMRDYAAASAAQIWYLAGLLAQKGLDASDVNCGPINTSATLTSRQASDLIDYYSGAAAAREVAAVETIKMTAEWSAAAKSARTDADAAVAAAFPADWAAAEALTGADRREAKRLLRRQFEAQS